MRIDKLFRTGTTTGTTSRKTLNQYTKNGNRNKNKNKQINLMRNHSIILLNKRKTTTI